MGFSAGVDRSEGFPLNHILIHPETASDCLFYIIRLDAFLIFHLNIFTGTVCTVMRRNLKEHLLILKNLLKK